MLKGKLQSVDCNQNKFIKYDSIANDENYNKWVDVMLKKFPFGKK